MVLERSVVCIGEALIDFFCTEPDVPLAEGRKFEKQAGGAPANVCAAIAKLGGKASFCGKAGNDPFGQFLKKTLDEAGVDTSMLVFDPDRKTTLAFVSLQKNGERDFLFNRGADGFLREGDIDKEKWNKAAIRHFGSATALLEDPLCSTYLNLMKRAKDAGHFISFDPNYRHDLWKGNESKFVTLAEEALKLADFSKMSAEELALISGKESVQAGLDVLHRSAAGMIAVTLGSAGTVASNRKERAAVSSIKVKSVDSTGAGDAFVGAFLYQLSMEDNPWEAVSDMEAVKRMTAFSNLTGAAVCTKIGAIAAMPSLETVRKLGLENHAAFI